MMPSVERARRKRVIRVVQTSLSALVLVAIFGLILPQIASYADVWATIRALTWIEMFSLIAATVFNLFTYWWQMQAAMPGLTLGQAAVSNQTSTTVSNLVPGAGVVATGLMYGMFHSWGFTGSEVALLASTTGIWNTFLKLGLPIIAVALLAIVGRATNTLLAPALIGLVFLAGSVILFAMMLWKKSLARAIGARLGTIWSSIRGLFHKPPVETWGEGAVRFRKQTIGLVVRRWPALTITTIASHLALWFVLVLSLRHVGVSAHEVSTHPGPRGLRVRPADLGHPHHAWWRGRGGARADRWSLRRRQDPRGCPARRVQGPGDGCRAPVPDLDVRGPDPPRGLHLLIWQRKKSWRKPQPDAPQPSVVPAGSPR